VSIPVRRLTYVLLAVSTITVGLVVHFQGAALGRLVRDVLGDVLWAAMIVWWVGAVAPRVSVLARAVAAFAVCAAVEASQAVHVPALDAVRATRVGHLVLGSDFDLRDLASYAIGVAAAALVDAALLAHQRRAG
jgi:hypothetical protein